MAKPKPVAYPNLMESMQAMVDAHSAMHAQVSDHATRHKAHVEQLRKQEEIKAVAHKLNSQGAEE